MTFITQPASVYTPAELAELFNLGFAGYFMPVNFSEEAFRAFVERDGVDLNVSRVLLAEGDPAGLALIARRGPVSRLAAMGLVAGARGRGAGSWLMGELLAESRKRGERRMFLEVIARNEPAIRLYEKSGFTKLRRLLGFSADSPSGKADPGFQPCTLGEVIRAFEDHSLPDLPWQVDAVTLICLTGPTFAFRLGAAYLAVSDPQAGTVVVRSLVCDAAGEGQEQAARLLSSLFATYPGKAWRVPPIFPEEMAGIFAGAGMKQDELSQWQMVCRFYDQ
ncbi:MAG: GNAT family N-acetyltransferase [Chloroflexota bacterium]